MSAQEDAMDDAVDGAVDDEERQQQIDHSTTSPALIAAAWTLVGVPLGYGLWQTALDAAALLG